ncbi:hypothetical protein BH11PSE3_BH11PSE3_51550 [soil metagenome]
MRLLFVILALLLVPTLAGAQSPAATPPVVASDAAATPPAEAPAAPPTVAEPSSPAAAAISASILPRDLSVWGMFVAADWLVQGVMIGLAVASVLTWTVAIAKSLELGVAVRRQRAMLRAIDGAPSLDAAPAGDLVAAARAEWKLSSDSRDDREGLKERVASRLERLEAAMGRRMLVGTGVLATIGATAPFVGLFGTVWGIMNSFIGISKSQTTNLAVVAPGIAEALLATTLGLAAAIPAVVIYNHFLAPHRGLSRAGRRHVGRCSAARFEGSRQMSVKLDHGDADLAETRKVNVTPFIDVLLVLLIIFMVAAPLATVDVPVELPASTAERQAKPDKPLYLTLKSDLSFFLKDEAVTREGLPAALNAATGGRKDERIFLRADKTVPYGELMNGMNLLRKAGYLKVALVGIEQ